MKVESNSALRGQASVMLNLHTQAGAQLVIEAEPGKRLMEVIRNSNAPIRAECGGVCACATCHVYIGAEWLALLPAPDENETALLEVADSADERSRLSCQIKLTEALDGMHVWLAPGSD